MKMETRMGNNLKAKQPAIPAEKKKWNKLNNNNSQPSVKWRKVSTAEMNLVPQQPLPTSTNQRKETIQLKQSTYNGMPTILSSAIQSSSAISSSKPPTVTVSSTSPMLSNKSILAVTMRGHTSNKIVQIKRVFKIPPPPSSTESEVRHPNNVAAETSTVMADKFHADQARSYCHCCLTQDANGEPLYSMKDDSFEYNNEKITYLDGYLDINNCSTEDFPNIILSQIRICGMCMVQLESAYIFRELCRRAKKVLSHTYSGLDMDSAEVVEVKKQPADTIDIISSDESTEEVDIQIPEVDKKALCALSSNAVGRYVNHQKIEINTDYRDQANALYKYCCLECSRAFKSELYFERHKKIAHPVRSNQQAAPKKSTKKFTCELCPLVYYSKHTLDFHVRTQHLKYPAFISFICNLCGKPFNSATALYNHEKITH